MKKIQLLFFFLFISTGFLAQSIGDDLQVSLLTCSSGDELYSTFGHSALRFHGMIDGKMRDEVYNYGTFEFGSTFSEEMNFYVKFAQGQLDYKLSEQNFPYFQYEYVVTNRGIVEQILDLDPNQKEALYQFMVNNVKPENCYYRYDFFFDNCSTRIRDVLVKVLGDDLVIHPDMALIENKTTFRDMIQRYLNDMPWSDFGIDIALGLPCDKEISPGEEMFLPEFLMSDMDRATIDGRPLVKTKNTLLEHEEAMDKNSEITPSQLLWGLFVLTVLIALFSYFAKKKLNAYFNAIFIITGLLGLLVFFLWFMTDHSTTKNNLNILWLVPLNLLVPLFGKRSWMKKYLKAYLFILIVILASFNWFPQAFESAFIPLILTILVSGITLLVGVGRRI